MKFTFIDKEELCVFEDGKLEKYQSGYVTRYRENSKREQKNREWKKNSDRMLYEDYLEGNERVVAEITSLSPTVEKNKILYSFTVNETSGIYYKYTDDEKKTEAHFLSSNEERFFDLSVNASGEIVGTVQKDSITSDIGVFSKSGGDYKLVTGGDSKDENPFLKSNEEILFNSYGVGRNLENEFVAYAPSEILKVNVRTMEIETLVSDGKNAYIKPILDGDGNLYCIRKPNEERENRNGFLEVLLIPVRIVEGIVGFISTFVRIFTGKPLVGGNKRTRGGNSAAKNAEQNKLYLHNQTIEVDKELKRNEKTEESGFIPRSWKLIRIPKIEDDFSVRYDPGRAEELAHGVADYCLTEEGALVYTNGKRIFELTEKGKKKLLNVDFCVRIASLQQTKGNLFDEL